MNSLTPSDEAPVRPLRVRSTFQTRVPGYRDRNRSTIRKIDNQGVFGHLHVFGLSGSKISRHFCLLYAALRANSSGTTRGHRLRATF